MTDSPAERRRITGLLKQAAIDLGFSRVGIAPAVEPLGYERFRRWLDDGLHGTMRYLDERREAYAHPRHVLDGVRSVVMLTLDYRTAEPPTVEPGQGRVSRYAWGTRDYHDTIRDRLHRLADRLRSWVPDALTRGIVDTAPLLERDFARLAGLGWQGKNTLLISKSAGSWFFLAALLTDVSLEIDRPHESDHCGTCTACLDACPTEAFPQPGVLDARRCVSYLTIELRGAIPRELRPGIGDRVFGCDDCQEVCPWQSKSSVSSAEEFRPDPSLHPLELLTLFTIDDAEFRRRFRRTPLWRAHRDGLLRNAAIVLGNARLIGAVPTLIGALDESSSTIRGAAAWALGEIGAAEGLAALRRRLAIETDEQVRDELHAALRTKA
ncbi:MAG TPA: tRNA epoxyqueuosine(34) reductase QueG [Planctomycetaceae bacterium]|nr:tRNA epoxyqueuosine(34) reductase QueG [Planctomycetaceae bacterium]HRF01231.1 tRNA epoxyqueuosine(34) reductase QueG [Pirellulaceae bacterium]